MNSSHSQLRCIGVGLGLISTSFASAQHIAYTYPQLTGNQSFSGALGMDFDVNKDIYITALGIFDSGQNGIQNNIDAYIYNRDTHQIVASRLFGPTSMGIGDGTTNFLDLSAPVLLSAGFRGSIVVQGYGILEKNGNSFSAGSSYAITLNNGGGLISFTGRSRHGNFGYFPTTVDMNVAQYGAGNFKYQAVNPVPEPASLAIAAFALASAFRLRKTSK